MATRFELVLDGLEARSLQAAGQAAVEEIEAADRLLSRFRRDSLVSFLEREGRRRPVRVPADVFELLELCLSVQVFTAGAFDVGVGRRMEELGFHPAPAEGEAGAPARPVGNSEERPPSSPSASLLLDAEAGTVQLGDPAARLDLGAVGKGFALDRVREVLEERGVPVAFVHGGTSAALAIGAPPDQPAWKVAIRDPGDPKVTLAVARLRDSALAVSAPHGRVQPVAAGAAGHILDARTGHPVATGRLAAVVHPSAARADAWSTALAIDPDLHPDDRCGTWLVVRPGPGRRVECGGARPEVLAPD